MKSLSSFFAKFREYPRARYAVLVFLLADVCHHGLYELRDRLLYPDSNRIKLIFFAAVNRVITGEVLPPIPGIQSSPDRRHSPNLQVAKVLPQQVASNISTFFNYISKQLLSE